MNGFVQSFFHRNSVSRLLHDMVISYHLLKKERKRDNFVCLVLRNNSDATTFRCVAGIHQSLGFSRLNIIRMGG